jgi:AraC family transcriptional regulator
VAFEPADYLPSTLELCSTRAGWKSLCVRRFADPAVTDPFDVPPIGSQLILLVKQAADNGGRPNVEVSDGSGWRSAHYRNGDLALTPPGRGVAVRWANRTPHRTVQVLIPERIMAEVAQDLGFAFEAGRFDRALFHDPLLSNIILSLERAAEQGAGETYAEAAAIFLAAHLLCAEGQTPSIDAHSHDLAIIDDYMVSHLGSDLSLAELAATTGISRFRLIRLCKSHWGETPIQRLARMRMEHGRKLLQETSLSIIEIALECGYGNPSHFAVAFRRFTGMSPREYRRR